MNTAKQSLKSHLIKFGQEGQFCQKKSVQIPNRAIYKSYTYSPATLKLNKGSPGSRFLLPFLSPLS